MARRIQPQRNTPWQLRPPLRPGSDQLGLDGWPADESLRRNERLSIRIFIIFILPRCSKVFGFDFPGHPYTGSSPGCSSPCAKGYKWSFSIVIGL
jgi:hypothetical protein